MGVIGLWNLIDICGTKVNVDTLNGKVLSIGKIFFNLKKSWFQISLF